MKYKLLPTQYWELNRGRYTPELLSLLRSIEESIEEFEN